MEYMKFKGFISGRGLKIMDILFLQMQILNTQIANVKLYSEEH